MDDVAGRSDQALWDAAVAGDANAYGELFTRHHSAVYNYCFRRVSSWAQAEDLMSAVFLEAWRTRQPLTLASGSLLPWLIGIGTHVTHRHHRSEGRFAAALVRVGSVTPTAARDHAEDVAARLDDERAMAEVLAAVSALPQIDQDVIGACVFAGLDYASAAEALDLPVGTVRSRLSRARARLNRTAPHLRRLSTQNG